MSRWVPLAAGIALCAAIVLGVIAWQVFSGNVGKTRGLVVTNLRDDAVVLSLSDGQSGRLAPGGTQTFVAKKAEFPETARVLGADGKILFEQTIEYAELSDAGFRIAIGRDALVAPTLPKP